jgi:hypothetical protein
MLGPTARCACIINFGEQAPAYPSIYGFFWFGLYIDPGPE